ncbi:NKG2-D type II integral membrane protein [Trichoplax sp. H2]|nr:NKG2-D type II integral membrane protein [Trichoplax sp. H2]|eukprot:RDD38996.1 NKG2-D type II integral membrane protein [Trichoplax sp. H2]
MQSRINKDSFCYVDRRRIPATTLAGYFKPRQLAFTSESKQTQEARRHIMALRLLLAFFSVLFINQIGISHGYTCPSGWTLHQNGQRTECFRLFNNSHIEWNDAKVSCAVSNGTLLQIVSPDIAAMVRKIYHKMSALAWIGMQAAQGNGAGSYNDYKWLNGQNFTLSSPSWVSVATIGKGAGKCVSLFLSHWKLVSETCDSKMNYLCHKGGADGQWTKWQNTSCSAPCGGGVTISTRTCTNPAPQGDGAGCQGPSIRQYRCNTHSCSTSAEATTSKAPHVETTSASSSVTKKIVRATAAPLESTEINGATRSSRSILLTTSVILATLLMNVL